MDDLNDVDGLDDLDMEEEVPPEYAGWWRIIHTSRWGSRDLDLPGTAVLSLTGEDDRLRMFALPMTEPGGCGVTATAREGGPRTREVCRGCVGGERATGQ